MSVQEQIQKLESLLERIRRKAQIRPPKSAAAAPANVQSAEAEAAVEPPPKPAPKAEEPQVAAHAAIPTPPAQSVPLEDQVEVLESLDAEDLVEISEPTPAPREAETDFDEEPAPKSAPRPAASIGQALDEAAHAAFGEEPPIKTPPPESGRQPLTMPPIPTAPALSETELSGAGEIDSLLETDLSGGPISGAHHVPGRPTIEQLGETVALEAPTEAEDLELAPPQPEPVAAVEQAPDELELSLPGRRFPGQYDESLPAPSSAASELAQRQDAVKSPPAASAASNAAPIEVETTARPAVAESAAPAHFTGERTPARAETFLSLLDSSLSLGN